MTIVIIRISAGFNWKGRNQIPTEWGLIRKTYLDPCRIRLSSKKTVIGSLKNGLVKKPDSGPKINGLNPFIGTIHNLPVT